MFISSYFSSRRPFAIIRYNFWFSLFLFILFQQLFISHWFIGIYSKLIQSHSDRLSIPCFYQLAINVFDVILRERTDSQRPRTQLNNPNLYCLMPFLGGFNDFCGWHQTSQDLKARNFRLNPAEHMIASKAKKPASPADITRALAPDLPSHGREPEHHNFKHS